MKLSKEASRLFAEYQRAQDEGTTPNYLSSDKLNDTFGAIRQIATTTDEIFNQVVYKMLEQTGYSL